MRRAMALMVVLLALAGPGAAMAAACPRTTVGDVEDEVMCPVCGTPLNLATDSPQARRERVFIQGLVDRCKSKGEIKTALAAEFGDRVLALPDDSGFGLTAYLVPALGLLLGIAGITLAAMRWRRTPRGGGGEAAGAPPDPHDAARLDADLERYRL
ncbi:MAG: cytochrome c-type biosis protein CcmH [Thermoleophilaceae bacterium]|nr:cytochrome c-type biosis protein CcmH [Thermoleophilaceae bacterium]